MSDTSAVIRFAVHGLSSVHTLLITRAFIDTHLQNEVFPHLIAMDSRDKQGRQLLFLTRFIKK